MTRRVGSEIAAICRRCGEIDHVVIALAGDVIAQVECAECGARHRYRPAGGPRPRPSTARKSATRTRANDATSVVLADPSRPCRSFRPRDTYEVGDRMLHPTFGEGVVQATRGATKVEVLFEAGTKLLVQGYGDS